MPDIDASKIIEAGAVSLVEALPVVIGALAQAGRTDLAKEVEQILGPEAKVVAELAHQDRLTQQDIKLSGSG